MFGSTNTGGSLFGQNKPATTGFGAAPAASSGTGFSFGNTSNNTSTAPATGGGLFGAKPAAPATGGLFGNNAGSTSNNTTQGSGFSFGANNNNANNTNANTSSGGLFGNNNNNANANTSSGGLFGNNSSNNNNNNTTTSTTGGLFGAKPAAPATGGLFGASNTSNTQQPSTGGLFGNNSTTTTQPSTGGLFGQNNAATQPSSGSSLFGGANNQANTQQQAPSTTSAQPAFAWSQQNSAQSQPQQQQPLSFLSASEDQNNANRAANTNNNYSITIQEQLTKVKNSWDPNSQQTVLKTYFYNTVPENQSALYTKPANENEEWDKAYENRPSTNSIPVRAIGFEDLQKRAQTQVNHVAQSRNILQQISEKYKVLSDKHELDTASRIVAAKAKHTRISRRILRLVSTLAVLKSKGYQLSPSEEKLIQTFQELLEKSQDPSGLGKTNELWARLAILKEKAKSLGEQLDSQLGIKTENADDMQDDEQTQEQVLKIATVLQEQQSGIKYLNEVLEGDKKTLEKLSK